MKKNKETQEKTKRKLRFKILRIVLILFIIGIISGLTLLYGPWHGFRDWLITTAMTTLSHQWMATTFYSEDTINKVLDNNQVIESGESTDTKEVEIIAVLEDEYENEYEEAILKKDEGNDLYKVIKISGKGYTGHLVAIYDPSTISLCSTKYLGTKGQYLVDMAKDNNAAVAINGGGFIDPNYNSLGGVPQGIVIKDGKVISNKNYTKSGGIIGFTNENKLILGKMSAKEALNKGVRDAVSFGPFLIVNGKASFIKGNGGWGTAPRSAIGQRKDGIVLFLVIDGRMIGRPGADMVDLTEIMQRYGAYNAANLDGGTSCGLVVEGKLINDPVNGNGKHKTRMIATGFMVKAKEENESTISNSVSNTTNTTKVNSK